MLKIRAQDIDTYDNIVLHDSPQLYSSTEPLTIGYYVDDGYCNASPACQRAVMLAKQALEKTGHTLVPWCPPNVAYAMTSFANCLSADGGADIIESM